MWQLRIGVKQEGFHTFGSRWEDKAMACIEEAYSVRSIVLTKRASADVLGDAWLRDSEASQHMMSHENYPKQKG